MSSTPYSTSKSRPDRILIPRLPCRINILGPAKSDSSVDQEARNTQYDWERSGGDEFQLRADENGCGAHDEPKPGEAGSSYVEDMNIGALRFLSELCLEAHHMVAYNCA